MATSEHGPLRDNSSKGPRARRRNRAKSEPETVTHETLSAMNQTQSQETGNPSEVLNFRSHPSSVLRNVLMSSDFVEESCTECLASKRLETIASSRCLHCRNYFCRSCFKRHMEQSCSKKLSSDASNNDVRNVCNVKCEEHQDSIQLICTYHDFPCCEECAKSHKTNETCNLVGLGEYVRTSCLDGSRIVSMKKSTYLKLNEQFKDTAETLKKVKTAKAKILASEEITIAEIEAFTNELVQKIISDSEALVQDLRRKLCEKTNVLDEIEAGNKQALGTMTKDLQVLGQPKVLKETLLTEFVRLKMIEKNLKNNEMLVKDSEALAFEGVTFTKNSHVVNFLKRNSGLGQLSVSPEFIKTANNEECGEDNVFKNPAMHIPTSSSQCFLSSWMSGDQVTGTCISSMVVVDDVTLFLADYDNRRLKLFTMASNNLVPLHSLTLDDAPRCICSTGSECGEYCVTFPAVKTVQTFLISESKIVPEHLKLRFNIECVGIVQIKDTLIVSGYSGDRCKLLSTNILSKETCVVYKQQDCPKGGIFLTRPDFLSKTADDKVLLISDADNGVYGVYTVDFKIVIFHCNVPALRCPLGVTPGKSGYVYVCGNQSYYVHHFSIKDGKENVYGGREVFQTRNPQSVVYNDKMGMLMVSFDNSYDICCLFV